MCDSIFLREGSDPGECRVAYWVWLTIWLALNVFPAWLAIYLNSNSAYRADRDDKPECRPFARMDYHKLSYAKALVWTFFFWPRMIIGWAIFIQGSLFTNIVCFGHKPGTPYKDWQLRVCRAYFIICGRLICFFIGYFRMGYIRTEADYRKWLGPDWKPEYEGAGINVINHTTPWDVPCTQAVMRPFTSFVGKAEAKKLPGLTGLIEICD